MIEAKCLVAGSCMQAIDVREEKQEIVDIPSCCMMFSRNQIRDIDDDGKN